MAEKRVELPSGGWAVFRDPTSVTARERKPLLDRALKARESGEPESPEWNLDYATRLIVLTLKSWSYELPLPKENVESLQDIGAMDLDTLQLAVIKPGIKPFVDTEQSDDPKATGDSSGTSRTESSTATSPDEIFQPSLVTTSSSSSESVLPSRD